MASRAEGVAILVANPSLSVILSASFLSINSAKNLEWLRAGSVKQSRWGWEIAELVPSLLWLHLATPCAPRNDREEEHDPKGLDYKVWG